METVGDRLKQLRIDRGLTQQDVADTLHLTRQAVSNYENDRTEADYETLRLLARLYETDLEYILEAKGASADPLAGAPGDAPRRRGRKGLWAVLATVCVLAVLALGILFVQKGRGGASPDPSGGQPSASDPSPAGDPVPGGEDAPGGQTPADDPSSGGDLLASLHESDDYPGWFYGLAGLYHQQEDELVCVSERPVKDLLFIMKPGDMGDPIILSWDRDPSEIVAEWLTADLILRVGADGGEEILFSERGHEAEYGLQIADIYHASMGQLGFVTQSEVGMGNVDVYHYVVRNSSYGRLDGDTPQLEAVWYEAGYPETHEGYSTGDPTGYQLPAIQKEQARLDALGIGVR